MAISTSVRFTNTPTVAVTPPSVLAPTPPAKGVTINIDAYIANNGNSLNAAALDGDFADLEAAHVTWVREYAFARTQYHSYSYSVVDQIVQLATRHHINLLGLMDEAASASFQLETVNRYKGVIHRWEMGNEANLAGQSPQQNAAYQRSGYQAIKAADPTATVVSNGFSEWQFDAPGGWGTQWFQAGGCQYSDAISFHPYSNNGASGVLDRVHSLESMMAQHGCVKPIWITEIGFQNGEITSNCCTITPQSARAQALMDMMNLFRADAHIALPAYWYTLHEDGSLQPGYGLISRDPNSGAKTYFPAYYVYRDLWS